MVTLSLPLPELHCFTRVAFLVCSRDPSLLLSSVVPVLEGAVTFFLDYMVEADDGLGANVQ